MSTINEMAFVNVPASRPEPAPLSSHTHVVIRGAHLSDVAAITEIYNEALLTTTATFDTKPTTVEDRTEWLKCHDNRHPVLVAEVDRIIVGWASLTRWSEQAAYDQTAEVSFYVHSAHRGHGVSLRLKHAIINEGRKLGYHTLIAQVADQGVEHLHLTERFGFVHVGTLEEVGLQHGRPIDVHIYQMMLRPV